MSYRFVTNSREQLIQEQREDPELTHIYRYLENLEDGSVNANVCEGRKIITPFRKLVLVTDGAEYVGGNIEKLFDEVRQNMQRQHKTNWETSSFDSINETTYEGKESCNCSNRSNSEKSRRSRKLSSNEIESSKSDKRNAGLEDLRFKRNIAIESKDTSERYDGKRPNICRKRSCRGSDYEQHRKRKAPVLPQGLKTGVPLSLYSRSHKHMRKDINKHPSQEPQILPGSSNKGQTRRPNPPL
ncbi:hypothetical protein TNCV_991101 [Trichonephila clavipes]|nr:hypothetical protein TNCV_991101 [Trichonephila clavipes]